MKKKNLSFRILFIISIFFTLFIYPTKSYSVDPSEILLNKKMENRARKISKNIRCLVCQNQSIDDSNAMLAKDLRLLIRNKIKKGNSDKEIYLFLTDRYGDFILLKPPFKYNTYILWFFPFIFFLIGIFIIRIYSKKPKNVI